MGLMRTVEASEHLRIYLGGLQGKWILGFQGSFTPFRIYVSENSGVHRG